MVGIVSSVHGEVAVIDTRGQSHLLQAGDWLREGDKVITGPGAKLALRTAEDHLVHVGESQTVQMHGQLSAHFTAHASDDAVSPWLLQQVLSMVHAREEALDVISLLALMPEQATFTAFAATPVDAPDDALQIQDLIQEQAEGHGLPGAPATDMIALAANTGLPSEVALQQQWLKDLFKE